MAEELRVVVFKDENMFIAQCLEIDIAAQGKTAEEAMKRLKVVFNAELEEARASGKKLEDIGPAPDAFRVMYSADVIEKSALVA